MYAIRSYYVNKERWETLVNGLFVAAAVDAAEFFADQPRELLDHLPVIFRQRARACRLARNNFV